MAQHLQRNTDCRPPVAVIVGHSEDLDYPATAPLKGKEEMIAPNQQEPRENGTSGPRVQPLNDWVMIEREKPVEHTPRGIVVPHKAQKKSDRGRVVRVGPGKLDAEGRRIPMLIKPGDFVVINRHCGQGYKLDGYEYLLIAEGDVLALLKD
jgi:chaperonin GroES